MPNRWPETERKTQFYYKTLSVLLTVFIGALGLVNWYYIREALLTLLMYFRVNPFSWRAIDNFSMVGLGMLWLVLVLASPYAMLRGESARGFWRNVSVIAGVQLLVLCVALLLPIVVAP